MPNCGSERSRWVGRVFEARPTSHCISLSCRSDMPEDPLHLVCIEPRFPGRLGWVADWLVRKRGCRCQFYCNSAEPAEAWPAAIGKGLDLVPFNVGGVAREPA